MHNKFIINFALVLPLMLGCGSGVKALKIVPVSGKVLLDGEAVADAEIQVVPAKGPASSATTDANGEFKLLCADGREGVVPGQNEVIVTVRSLNTKGPKVQEGREEITIAPTINTVYRYVEPIAMNEATTSLSLDLSKAAKMQR